MPWPPCNVAGTSQPQRCWRRWCCVTPSPGPGPHMGWGSSQPGVPPPASQCPQALFRLCWLSCGLLQAPMYSWLSPGSAATEGQSSCIGAADGLASARCAPGPGLLACRAGVGRDGLCHGTWSLLQELPGPTGAPVNSCCPGWPASTRKPSRDQGSCLAHWFRVWGCLHGGDLKG